MIDRDNADAILEQYQIPEHCREGIKHYLLHHHRMGHFLTAVFENDLVEACRRADDTNIHELRRYTIFMHNELPGRNYGPGVTPWGSPELVKAWLAGHDDG